MKKIKALVLRCAGTNCDQESVRALEAAGAEARRVHVNALISGEASLADFGLLMIPGGFSFGDDIASGKVLANKILSHLKEPLQKFLEDKKPVIGVCNGFQVLVKCGLLPGAEAWDGSLKATLTANDSGKFECRWTYLKVSAKKSLFTQGLPDVFPLPVAHGEGKFVPESRRFHQTLVKNGQIVFRYVDPRGKKAGFPWNPNGAFDDVAGITNAAGNVLGLMPHPERYAFAHQYKEWTRESVWSRQGVGLKIFQNAVKYAQKL